MVYKTSGLKWWIGSVLVVLFGLGTQLAQADSSTYGMGTYGSCAYNTCGISLTSSSSVNLNVTPISGTKCTVDKDSVAVLTDSSSGYTLQVTDGDSANQLVGAGTGTTISAVGGSAASPAVLAAGKWGYRVDGTSGFGNGPTGAQSNGAIPPVTFAALPLSTDTPDIIASSVGPADPAVTTTVWYGVCADSSQKSDTYSDNVTYTAIVN